MISADYKVGPYDGIDCRTALNSFAQTFETKWWIVGTTLFLGKCEHRETLELAYSAAGTAASEKSESMSPSVRRKQRAFDSSLSMPWKRGAYSYSNVLA